MPAPLGPSAIKERLKALGTDCLVCPESAKKVGVVLCVWCNSPFEVKIEDLIKRKRRPICEHCLSEERKRINTERAAMVMKFNLEEEISFLSQFFDEVRYEENSKRFFLKLSGQETSMSRASFSRKGEEERKAMAQRFRERMIKNEKKQKEKAAREEAKERKKKEVRERFESFIEKTRLVLVSEFEGVSKRATFKCLECGDEFEYLPSILVEFGYDRCQKCRARETGQTSLESFISKILDETGVSYEFRTKFEGKMELDFYIPERGLGIEVNGSYWHRVDMKPPDHLQKKKLYFLEKGINVLFFYDFQINRKPELLAAMLRAKLGLYKERFGARELSLEKVGFKEAQEFFEENHLSGSSFFRGDLAYALVDRRGRILSLLALSKPRFDKRFDYEIARFASKRDIKVAGAFSRLLKAALQETRAKRVVSYADMTISDGTLYVVNGFYLAGITPPGFVVVNKKTGQVRNRLILSKRRWGFLGETQGEIARHLGLEIVPTPGSMKFVIEW